MRAPILMIVLLLTLASTCTPAVETPAIETSFAATKDVRIPFDPSEVNFNCGQSARLRARDLGGKSGEAVVLDFERKAIASFLDAHKRKRISAHLVIFCKEGQAASATVDAAILDTTSEWTEGTKNGATASEGEVTFAAAEFGGKPWTNADGKAVADFRELFYDKAYEKFRTLVNAHVVQVGPDDKGKPVRLELDGKFLECLARSPTCKGLILCTRGDATADFSSREQSGQVPRLVLTIGDK